MRILFLVVAGAGGLALVLQVGRILFSLKLATSIFLAQIEKLVRAQNVDRAIKLTRAHDGPVCRLTYVGLVALQSGRGAEVANQLQMGLPSALAQVTWMAWPARVLGLLGIALGMLHITTPLGLGVVLGLAFLILLSFMTESGLRRDLELVAVTLRRVAHGGP